MTIRALRCRLTPSGSDPLDVIAWTGAAADLDGRRTAEAYLIVDEALANVRHLPTIFTDRGRKHESRSLSAILLGHAGVPIVQASLKSGRQLLPALRTLLENASARKEQKAYVIAVSRRIFERTALRFGATFDDDGVAAVPEQDLFIGDPEEVPAVLKETLIGESARMRVARQAIVRAARHDEPILVLGDSGTGKEVVARMIHDLDHKRRVHQFVAINCGAIPRDLFESQVFGYVGGAFSGALKRGSPGLWRIAQGGTLFLDEFGDLAPEHQGKILRVVEQNEVWPVGATGAVPVTARVIAATNKDLFSMMLAGDFRDDLYYRVGSMVINLPRLSDYPDDAARLAEFFWKKIAPGRPPLPAEVLREVQRYRWRGNARELRAVLVNMHIAFPKAISSVECFRAVLRVRASDEGRGSGSRMESALDKVECLRHLSRARAAIDACQRLVRAFGSRNLDADRRARLAADAGGCLTELQLLGTKPEKFRSLGTFEITHRLAGGLAVFQSLLARNDPGALRYCKKELAEEVASAGAAVRREEQRILKSL